MMSKILTNYLHESPKKLFLLDGFGALLSAFLLGVVLVNFENVFGIPKQTLYFLAFLPCLFAVYDFACYFLIKNNFGPYLKIIACINVGYCIISLGLAFYHMASIEILGWIYIIIEIAIVVFLAMVEWSVANKINKATT